MLLSQVIAKKKEQHDRLRYEIEAHDINNFLSIPFQKKLAYIRLKNELANLHLAAAILAKKHNCLVSYGKHLRNVLLYNPYCLPNLTRNLKYRNDLLPKLYSFVDTAAANIINGSWYVITFPFAQANSMLDIFGGALMFSVYEHTIERAVHSLDVYLNCLADVPSHYSAEDCFYIGISLLNDEKYYQAIHFLSESDIRSTSELLEIIHYYNHCINGLVDGNEAQEKRKLAYINRVYTLQINSTRTTVETIETNISKIRQKVLSSDMNINRNFTYNVWIQDWDKWRSSRRYNSLNHREMKPRTEYCYKKNEFCSRISGELVKSHSSYHLTIPEIVMHLRKKMYEAHPTLKPEDEEIVEISSNQLASHIPLVELIAYMTQLMKVPDIYLKLAITANGFNENNAEAIEYLNLLLKPELGLEMTPLDKNVAYIFNPTDDFNELIALLLSDKNYIDCEKIQNEFPCKYWKALHVNLSQFICIQSLPLHLKNPIEYISRYTQDKFQITDARRLFFLEFIEKDCDLKKKLENLDEFNIRLPYQQSRKKFYLMMMALSQFIETKEGLDMVKSFIQEYHENSLLNTNRNSNNQQILNHQM